MSLDINNEIIGFEVSSEIFCPECWKQRKRLIYETVTILTASNAAEQDEMIRCNGCGRLIWE